MRRAAPRRSSGPAAWPGSLPDCLYGLYGPLVFHDGFAYRDGPVAHVSALLLALPLLASETEELGGGREEDCFEKGKGRPERSSWGFSAALRPC